MIAFFASEAREFSGFLPHLKNVIKPDWPIAFARTGTLNGTPVILAAHGPGPRLAAIGADIVRERAPLTAVVSTGFCGALDPALSAAEVVVGTHLLNERIESPLTDRKAPAGPWLSMDRVITTSGEKSQLRSTGALFVEMEAAPLLGRARGWNLPFYCVRAVTDTAREGFALDFNQMRDAEGRFSQARIIRAALRNPAILFPELLRLNHRCKKAAQALGDFVANCRF